MKSEVRELTSPLSLRNMTLAHGSNILLEDINVSFRGNSLTALIGRNGAGKSTLLRQIAGLGPNMSDSVIIEGRPQKEYSSIQLAKRISYVGTNRSVGRDLTLRQAVELGRAPYTDWIGRLSHKDIKIVNESMEMVGVSKFAERRLGTLSDGECQRAMIARALAQKTPILLLDEPTSFLDIPNRYAICQLLFKLAHEEGKTILFSTHELDIALKTCDYIAFISTPNFYLLPAKEMEESGLLAPLLSPIL